MHHLGVYLQIYVTFQPVKKQDHRASDVLPSKVLVEILQNIAESCPVHKALGCN